MDNLESTIAEALAEAAKAREAAYAPYSRFQVGAALVTSGGGIHRGANVENLSFGLTICAERVAVSTAVTLGAREFELLVLLTDSSEPIAPCGACRQVIAEFAPGLQIVSFTTAGARTEYRLSELLPAALRGILARS